MACISKHHRITKTHCLTSRTTQLRSSLCPPSCSIFTPKQCQLSHRSPSSPPNTRHQALLSTLSHLRLCLATLRRLRVSQEQRQHQNQRKLTPLVHRHLLAKIRRLRSLTGSQRGKEHTCYFLGSRDSAQVGMTRKRGSNWRRRTNSVAKSARRRRHCGGLLSLRRQGRSEDGETLQLVVLLSRERFGFVRCRGPLCTHKYLINI
jgi:hypothetical protein